MKKKLLLLTLIMVLILPTIVFADTFRLDAKLIENEPKVYKEKDEIKIDLNIAEINLGEDGVNVVEGVLEYDEDLFEVVSSENINGKDGWSFTINDGETGQKGKFLGMILSAGEKDPKNIATITLKVRENVKKSATSSDIVIKEIKTNDGNKFYDGQDVKIQVPLQVEYKGFNPIIIVVVIASVAILLGVISIINKKHK